MLNWLLRGPKPYFETATITIYHADCREVLGQVDSVDLIVTDPPYGMDWQTNRRIVKYERIVGDDSLPLDTISNCLRIARNAVYVCCRWDNLADMPKPRSLLAWVKNMHSTGDLHHEHGRQWEAIAFYPLEGHKFTYRMPDVLDFRKTGNDLHPTEKPVDLMRMLIECNVGETVLDPFMGSGTTLLAAVQANRKAIGIEIDERHCETAVRRLETIQSRLF